jgi:TPP-dependent pyruvate/acetoin dehydrogenase alpha subunit
MSYVPEAMREEWADRDPIEHYSEELVAEHGFSADEVDSIRAEVKLYVDECAQRALASPMPDPDGATAGVFADEITPLGDGKAPWSYWTARGIPGREAEEIQRSGSETRAA